MALGRPKKIESPEKLWEYFLSYKKEVKGVPFLVKDWVGKDANEVYREKEKPLTIEGFENYLEDKEIISDLSNYFANSNNAYANFSTICSRIKRNVRQDQIEGGMTGIYNPSITQRLNSLVEKSEVTEKKEQPLFGDV
jgi:cellulase/cellobiase CelA1